MSIELKPRKVLFEARMLVALGIVSAITVRGHSADASVLQRRDTAIKHLNEYYVRRGAGPLWTKVANHSLVALTNATVESLKRPVLTSAIVIQRTNQSVALWIHWIGALPSANRVELDVGDGKGPLSLPIVESELKENDSQAKRTVLFNAGFGWKSDQDVARRLSAVTTPVNLKARLLRDAAPLTGWSAVDLNKAGNWVIAGKQ